MEQFIANTDNLHGRLIFVRDDEEVIIIKKPPDTINKDCFNSRKYLGGVDAHT